MELRHIGPHARQRVGHGGGGAQAQAAEPNGALPQVGVQRAHLQVVLAVGLSGYLLLQLAAQPRVEQALGHQRAHEQQYRYAQQPPNPAPTGARRC